MTKVTTFWSATGGVGKTTLAVAQAIMLAREEKEKVVLLDFNEVTPHIHKMLGLKLMDLTGVYDAIEQDSIIADIIKPCLQKKHGIWVLTGICLEEFDRFEEKHFSAIIQALKDEFSNVIIDCNAGIYFASTLASLRNSDEIKVVTAPTSNYVKDTIMFMDFIQNHWGIEKEKQNIILNKVSPSSINPESVRALLNTEIKSVKYDPKAIKLQELGKIFIPQEMNVSDTNEKPKKGFFSFLARGREDVADKPI